MAIARHESGMNPLAINVAGKGYFPKTQEEAEVIINAALAVGKSFDVGLMQINNWWHKKYNLQATALLDPQTNITWGVWILGQEIARHGLSWQAIGAYHSPDQERGRQYSWRVYAKLDPAQSIPRHVPNKRSQESRHAEQKTSHQTLRIASGIQRDTVQRQEGRIITFGVRQEGLPWISRAKHSGQSGSSGTFED